MTGDCGVVVGQMDVFPRRGINSGGKESLDGGRASRSVLLGSISGKNRELGGSPIR